MTSFRTLAAASRRSLNLIIALTALVSGSAAHAASENVLHIGYQKGTPLTLLKAQGTLDRELATRDFKIEWIEFPAGPPLLEAMNAGSIDLGYTGAPPPIFAQAAGSHIVYLAAEPSGPHNEALIVRANSPLKSVADLRGHTVALTKGSSSEYLLVEALGKAGLKLSDIKPIFLIPSDARAAFEGGKVDAWAIWDPYLAVVQKAFDTRTLADYASGITQPFGYFLGAPDFVKAHRDVIELVFAEVSKNDLWVQQHQDETVKLIAAETGIPSTTVKFFLDRSKFGLLPLSSSILESQQHVADVFYQAGAIPNAVRIENIVLPIPIVH